jgi:aminoglycoside phosphotransferase (APT) family kinase protein
MSTERTPNDLKAQLIADGVISSPEATLTPFSGGVSSDVYLVVDGGRQFVVKQALEKLRVQDEWLSDPARIVCEQSYLEYVGARVPAAVPQVLDIGDGYFTMEYVAGLANWKAELLAGRFSTEAAQRAGEILGAIHRVSYRDPTAEELFPNHLYFHQLRIDAYLLTTAERTPEVRQLIEAEAERLAATHECLVHGDFSPKNMLVGTEASEDEGRVVLLDCETANFGDGAFDLAFILTHLHLKGLFHAPVWERSRDCIETLVRSYFTALGASPERTAELDMRAAHLLQIILLARVNGKSPAEYLNPAQQTLIRELIPDTLPHRQTLQSFLARWLAALPH